MKKSIILQGLAFLIMSTAPALANPYLSFNFGASWLEDSDLSVEGYDSHGEHAYDIGYVMDIAVGNSLDNGFRLEAEIPYRFNDIDKYWMAGLSPTQFDREISLLAMMGNAYYDFNIGNAWQPFVGAGVGYGLMQIEGGSDHHDAGVFVYQAMIGCGHALSDKLTIDLQYRALATEDPEFKTGEPDVGGVVIQTEYLNQNLMLGVRYNF